MATPSDDTTNNANNGTPQGGAGTPGGEGQPQTQQPARPSTNDLPPEVLKLRLEQEAERGARKEREALFSKYGVRTEEELAAKMQRLGALEETDAKRSKEDEERKRASMSSEERLRAENEELKGKVQQLQSQLDAANGKLASLKQGQVVRQHAADFVDPDLLEDAERAFAAHVKALREANDATALAKYDKPGEIRGWFRDFVLKRPKFAKPSGTTTAAGGAGGQGGAAKPVVARKPITTGSSPAKTTPPARVVPAPVNGKTMRPGQRNSMTDKEVAEHIGKTMPGVRIPGMSMS